MTVSRPDQHSSKKRVGHAKQNPCCVFTHVTVVFSEERREEPKMRHKDDVAQKLAAFCADDPAQRAPVVAKRA